MNVLIVAMYGGIDEALFFLTDLEKLVFYTFKVYLLPNIAVILSFVAGIC